jgi:geranylgeranyl reductase family protein
MGPAGANAAYHLGRSGMKVLAFEKRNLPRTKLCAGGITAKSFPLLDFDFSLAVEQEIRSAYICFRHGHVIDYPDLDKAGYVVDRRSFDYLLANRAKDNGVEIHDNERVITIAEYNGFIQVSTGIRDYRCRALIGADGVNGVTAKYLGQKGKSTLLGLEVHVPKSVPVISEKGARLGFYFGDIPGGYGWIFPRKNDASLGIGINSRLAAVARRYLTSFLEKLKIPEKYASATKGHLIPAFSPFTVNRYCRGNILLAGDAGSFVDPITGEGIYYALKSGQDAACSILNAGPGETASDTYKQFVENGIIRELRAAWKIAKPLYAFPNLSFRLYNANAAIREKHFQVLLGQATYSELWRETVETVKGVFRFRSWPG